VHVAFHGTLTLPTAPLAHTTVLKGLAEQPLAMIIDVSELTSRSNVAVPVFLAMRRQARRQPAVPLVVVASRTSVGSSLRSALGRYLPTCNTLDEALDVVNRMPAAGYWRHLRLAPDPSGPQRARNLVAEACAEWGVARLMHAARTVVSELVSNAVEHAGTDVELTIALRGNFLCLAVRDGSPALPRLREPVPHDPHAPLDIRGYGVRMLANVAHSWGAEVTSDGKVVWALLSARRDAVPAL
jgi:anti-sigma regulatory factor (Ser/Thr protein kinase)